MKKGVFSKTIISTLIVLMTMLVSLTPAFAANLSSTTTENVYVKEYNVNVGEGTLQTIDKSEIPENVKPIRLKDEKELYDFIQKMEEETDVLNTKNSINVMSTSSIPSVSEKVGLGTVYLKARYTTSGTRVTSVSPFTQFTGFTYGITWEQNTIGSKITSTGKDFEAWTSGTAHTYILLDSGMTRLFSRPVDLDMYVMVFR